MTEQDEINQKARQKRGDAPLYEPEVCECCGQTKTYLLGIDQGTVEIVKAIARKVGEKGINMVHPRKEGVITATQWCNISRPRSHGLIASVRGERGNFLLTRKGAQFLRGARVPRYAIISKAEGHQIGYFEPENYTTTVEEACGGEYWEGINYEITEGNVILKSEAKGTLF